MKKLFYAAAMLLALSACDNEATNPGDFSVKSTLSVERIWTESGQEYPVTVVRETDTVYQASRFVTLTDEATGEETEVEEWYDTDTRGHFVELALNTLPSPADTIYIKVNSNAKWRAPMPDNGGKTQWFFTQRQAGGGDGTVVATVNRNRNKQRPVNADQYIMTSDSTVMFKVSFAQKGEND